jgi:hypothetical protein
VNEFHWSATTNPQVASNAAALGVDFRFGTVGSVMKDQSRRFWCVLGGVGADGVQ